jgi:YVTN family beta-propeller protein
MLNPPLELLVKSMATGDFVKRLALAAALAAGLIPAGCHSHDFPNYEARYREYAYVSNSGTNTVTVLDLVNIRLDRIIQVGFHPSGLAASPTRNEIYAVNSGSGTVSVIDAEKNEVAATIPVHREPYSISVDTEGKRGYVANSGSNTVSVIDLPGRRVLATVGVGEQPGFARVSPDGSAIAVSNHRGNSVSVIDPVSLKVRSVWEGCPGATDIAILPDSSKAFIACSGGHQVMVVGLARAAAGATAVQPDRLIAFLDVGRTPVHLALKPDGGEIFVSNFDSNTISEIATGSNEVGGTYLVGIHPSRGIVSSDNSLLYVSNFGADTVAIYGIDDGRLVGSMHTGHQPDALAFSAAGHLLLAVDSGAGDLALLRTRLQAMFTLLPTGDKPSDVVVKAFEVKK